MGITPAALGAFLDGDFDNFMIASTPGGIEQQEAQGQQHFASTDMLPKNQGNVTREDLEFLGFAFGEDIDDLFIQATLPEGWSKIPTEHSMHTHIIDEQGRLRASVFYQAAFYDRRADMTLLCRFSYGSGPIGGYGSPEYERGVTPFHARVTDGDQIIWRSEPIEAVAADASREEYAAFLKAKREINEQAKEWLNEHYPEWRFETAYWR